MIRQVVIDKTTKKVKRWGYCDLANDGVFDSEIEQVIESDFVFSPPVKDSFDMGSDWYWNASEETFQQTAP